MAKKKKQKRKNRNYETRLSAHVNTIAQTGLHDFVKSTKPVPITKEHIQRIQELMHATEDWANRFAKLCCNYPGLRYEDVGSSIEPLNIQYNEALILKNRILPRDKIDRMNWIDLTAISDDELDTVATNAVRTQFQNEPEMKSQFYNIIPCFTAGIIQQQQRRMIRWEILDLDFEHLSITLYLQDYLNKSGHYLGGIDGKIKIDLLPGHTNEDGEYDQVCQMSVLEEHDFPEIYREISQKQLGWNELEYRIWQMTVIEHCDNVAAQQARLEMSVLTNLARIFLTYITVTNYIMRKHRVKTVENKENAAPDARRIETPDDRTSKHHTAEKPVPERITHHIGQIKIISATRPRRPTKSSVRNYRLESWERRGHVRHLKSGKQVYIRPSVYHRKSMNGKKTDVKQPATTIKIHNEI